MHSQLFHVSLPRDFRLDYDVPPKAVESSGSFFCGAFEKPITDSNKENCGTTLRCKLTLMGAPLEDMFTCT